MVHFSAGVFILGDPLWLQCARQVGDVGRGVVDLALDISDGGIAASSSSSRSIVGSDSDISEGVLIGGIRFHDASFGILDCAYLAITLDTRIARSIATLVQNSSELLASMSRTRIWRYGITTSTLCKSSCSFEVHSCCFGGTAELD